VTYLIGLHPNAKTIGDPMVGCGTVAVEAVSAGKSGFYSDIDPLCCLLTKAKTRTTNPDRLMKEVDEVLKKCKSFAKPSTTKTQAQRCLLDLEKSTRFRAPPNVFHWFDPYVVVNLCLLLERIAEIERNSRQRDALMAIFASVIRRVSRADPRTSSGLEVTRIRRKELLDGLRFDVAAEFRRKAMLMARGYRELLARQPLGNVTVVKGDARHWANLCARKGIWPDLVITSPCYLSAIEYWRRHRLEYCWLGLVDPEKLRELRLRFLGMSNENPNIEALPIYVRRLHSKLVHLGHLREAAALAHYFNDSASWLQEIAKVLERNQGTAYVVVGCSSTRGQMVNTPLALSEIAHDIGLSARVFLQYRIVNCYMQYPTNGMRITTETVLRLISSA